MVLHKVVEMEGLALEVMQQKFEVDGAIKLEGLLDDTMIAECQRCFATTLHSPEQRRTHYYGKKNDGSTFDCERIVFVCELDNRLYCRQQRIGVARQR